MSEHDTLRERLFDAMGDSDYGNPISRKTRILDAILPLIQAELAARDETIIKFAADHLPERSEVEPLWCLQCRVKIAGLLENEKQSWIDHVSSALVELKGEIK